jgi:hypothetical protein
MRNIVIKNVYAEVPMDKPDAGYNYEGPVEDLPRNISPAIIACGIPGYKIEDVTLENIEIVMPGAGNPLYAYRGTSAEDLDGIPEMIDWYPEFSQWKELPAWAMFLRHCKGFTLNNVSFKAAAADYRPAVVADDVESLKLVGITYNEPASDGKEQVVAYKSTVE